MAGADYIQILIESLEKKIGILKSLQEQSNIQADILDAKDFDDESFDKTMDIKERLIDDLQFIDNGFDAVYNRVREELVNNKQAHRLSIERMQNLIREITDLSSGIQATEQRNDLKLKNRFKAERAQLRQSKATVQAVTGYYRTMTSSGYPQAQFMDHKQ